MPPHLGAIPGSQQMMMPIGANRRVPVGFPPNNSAMPPASNSLSYYNNSLIAGRVVPPVSSQHSPRDQGIYLSIVNIQNGSY